MPLKDIGNGIGIVDAAPYVDQFLKLRSLQAQEAGNELTSLRAKVGLQKDIADLERAPYQLEQEKAKAAQERAKVVAEAANAAISGDFNRANELVGSIGEKSVFKPHPKKAMRDSGWVIQARPDGTETEVDIFANTKVKDRIALEAELVKKAALARQATPTDVSTLATELIQKKIAQTAEDASQQAKAIFAASGRKLTSPDGKTSVRLGDLPQQTIADYTQSAIMVKAATDGPRRPQGAPAGGAKVNMRLVPREKVPDKDREGLTGIFNSNKVLLRDVIPQFVELSNDSALGTNLLNTPIQNIAGKFGANDKRFLALQTLLGQNLFDKIKADSGAAFTEQEYAVREKLMPNASDTLGQAIAKVSALVALNTTTANSRLQGLEATDHDVAGLRRLFSGIDLPNVPAAEAQSILNTLPKELLENRNFMEEFVEILPPGMRDASDAFLKNAGRPRSGGVARDARKALGIGGK